MTDLNGRLMDAHARDDRPALVGLYTEAGNSVNDHEAACFYLTHAYVFALEAGVPEASRLHARLKAAGREE